MGFELPQLPSHTSQELVDAANAAAITGRLAIEHRTILFQPDGSREDVAQHSHMLGKVATALAAKYYAGSLDVGQVSLFANIHDDLEAYSGDTPTYNIDEAGLKAKAERELTAQQQYEADFSDQPFMVELMRRYVAQDEPEARFVRVLDKLMPLFVYVNDDCRGLIKIGQTADNIRGYNYPKAARLRQQYPEFSHLTDLLEELIEVVANRLESQA